MKTSLFFFTFAAGFGLLNLIIRWNYIWDYNEWYCGRSCCVPISVSAAYWHSSKDTHTSAFDQIDIRNPDYVKAKHSKTSGKNIFLLTPFLLCCICVEFSPAPKTLTYKRCEWVILSVSEWQRTTPGNALQWLDLGQIKASLLPPKLQRRGARWKTDLHDPPTWRDQHRVPTDLL